MTMAARADLGRNSRTARSVWEGMCVRLRTKRISKRFQIPSQVSMGHREEETAAVEEE